MSVGPARAGWFDLVRLGALALGPNLLQGPVIRRRWGVRVAARLDTNAWACRVFDHLRQRHGQEPVLLNVFGRRVLLLLKAADARRVLEETGTSFTTASREKLYALGPFEPGSVLLTRGAERPERRRFNEEALDFPATEHRMCASFRTAIQEEAQPLLAAKELTWPRFHDAYQRIVRRIVLGDTAANDERITEIRDRLRTDGNLFVLGPRRHALRRELFARTQRYVDRAEPGSLARAVAHTPRTAATDPVAQMQHWFFAFDAAPIGAYLALGLLARHPDHKARALTDEPYMRACVLESQRLWPTSLAILRDSTADTQWPGGWTLPAGSAVVFYSSFFHRDEKNLSYADRFEPAVWLDGRAEADWSIAPFSRGPAACAGRHIVLFTSATLLSSLLSREWRLHTRHSLGPERPLPRTADHTSLRFTRDGG
ncbi:cytochrome P450 [Streptomyces sp. NPDC003077]|uniref:cytochrome P450 n=1 Tax=Streptomyces sp. NPDC003077 TaxID=3154443 RepID=UPI0033A23F1A